MHKRPMPSCGVCLCVCLSVTFVDHVKTNKHIFKNFSPSGSTIILVFFPYQTGWRYSDGNPLTGASKCRWGRQKRDSGRIYGFAAYRSTVLSTVRRYESRSVKNKAATNGGKRRALTARRPSSVVRTRGRRSVCDGLDVIGLRRRLMEVKPPRS